MTAKEVANRLRSFVGDVESGKYGDDEFDYDSFSEDMTDLIYEIGDACEEV